MNTHTETTSKPSTPQFMTDAQGNQIRVENIKPIDLARDALVKEIITKGRAAGAHVERFKSDAFADIAALVEMSAEEYGAKIGGNKGNVTMFTFDGKYKINRAITERIMFDERLQAAKGLIDECLNDWTKDSNAKIQSIIHQAFEVDKEGNINTNRVLGLRRLGFDDDARWTKAMTAISESVQVVGSKSYVRLYERDDATGEYVPIKLDLTGA